MKPLSERVLLILKQMEKDALDLHVLFEAGGNNPQERQRVLDAIDELTREGLLDAQGNDFYALTDRGRRAVMDYQ